TARRSWTWTAARACNCITNTGAGGGPNAPMARGAGCRHATWNYWKKIPEMSQTKNFNLPDLGEGLPDATIVEWFVKEGDVIKLDEPLVSMETAKAVVEVPSPFSGKVLQLAGAPGDIVITGHM